MSELTDKLRFAVLITKPLDQDEIVSSWNWLVNAAREGADAIEEQEKIIQEMMQSLKFIVNDSRGTTRNALREIADEALSKAKKGHAE